MWMGLFPQRPMWKSLTRDATDESLIATWRRWKKSIHVCINSLNFLLLFASHCKSTLERGPKEKEGMAAIQVGMIVLIVGHESEEFNGLKALCLSYDKSTKRFVIKLIDRGPRSQPFSVKAVNLKCCDSLYECIDSEDIVSNDLCFALPIQIRSKFGYQFGSVNMGISFRAIESTGSGEAYNLYHISVWAIGRPRFV